MNCTSLDKDMDMDRNLAYGKISPIKILLICGICSQKYLSIPSNPTQSKPTKLNSKTP